ncbi:MAG: phosphatase PAP2 family protein [Candidatus Dormiibacterota bacterium]
MALLVVLVAIHSARTPEQAVVTGIVAACFGSLLPVGYVLYQVRRRRLSDVHVGVRSQRPLVLLVALASVLVGLALLLWLGAPRQLLGLVIAGITGIVVCLAVSTRWKLSIHLAVAAGTAVLIAYTFTPWCLLLLLLTIAVGWARLRLGDHTVSQVVAGALLGGLIAAVVYPVIVFAS